MIQFPIVWLVTVLATIAAVTLAQNAAVPQKARLLLCAFLMALATLAGLVGARLAAWVDWVFILQPVLAVTIAPLAYLGFRALTREGLPSRNHLLAFYLAPILIIQSLFVSPLPMPIDFVILAVNIVFLVRLALLVRLSGDDFPHTPPHALGALKAAMIATVILFILMVSSDLVILVAVLSGGNGPAMQMVSGASGFFAIFTLLVALIGSPMLMKSMQAPKANLSPTADKKTAPSEEDERLLRQIGEMVTSHQLYRDSNLTLARLARRVGVPSRDISSAINRTTRENFSRYINFYRIDLAKSLLQDTDLPVTEIMFEAGFISKSSFNSEFRRITGQTPTQFRAGKK